MASPQPDQFTKISNELLEIFALVKFTVYERAIIDVIIRKTYGYQQKEDWISNSQFVEATGLYKQHCSRTINGLIKKNVVTRTGYKIGLQKDYEKWKVTWRGYNSNLERLQKLPREAPQKKKEKRNISKQSLHKNNDMGWNNKADDYLEGDIDLDGDGTVTDPEKQLKEKNAEKLRYKKDLVEWLMIHQKRDRDKTPQSWRNKQFKALEELYVMHTPRTKIIEAVQEYEKADWFEGKPDFRSIVRKFEKQL